MRITRRTASVALVCATVRLSYSAPRDVEESHFASGVKVGEVTPTSAIIWARLTKNPERNPEEPIDFKKKNYTDEEVNALTGACPGMKGKLRVRWWTGDEPKAEWVHGTEWADVDESSDYSHTFLLEKLQPNTKYNYKVYATSIDGQQEFAPLAGTFQTAPGASDPQPIRFCVLSCQMFEDLDDSAGFNIYPAMMELKPQFVVFTGDNVYYDRDRPHANTPRLASWHWERMYSLPRHRELIRNIVTYWEKDDHDVLSDDTWPGRPAIGTMTFEEGLKIYRQQVPMSKLPYRTFRWGKDVQVWFTEGRDFRTPNKMPDGPDKRILGAEQEEWLTSTLKESDATWKILVSPTPYVGPDRKGKNDNDANAGFETEGNRLRSWFAENLPDNFFIVCGDRHWQYESIHPVSKVHEFAVGGASDQHAGGTPGEDPAYHRFHRVKGGFVSVTVTPQQEGKAKCVVQHHDVHGKVVNEWASE